MRATRGIPSAQSAASAPVDAGAGRPPPPSAGDVCDDNCRLGLVGTPTVGQVSVTADGTDGADANGLTAVPDLLETPSRPVRTPTSERLAEVLEALGLPTLARRLSVGGSNSQ
jgi:hypothetical protein